jgi:hypothetical protein
MSANCHQPVNYTLEHESVQMTVSTSAQHTPERWCVVVDDGFESRGLLWMTVGQPKDGAVSIGFLDGEFCVPGLQSQMEFEGAIHVQQVDFGGRSQQELTDPHFTFHPPNRIHLHASKENYLAEELVMRDLELVDQHRVPWLMLVSKDVRLLDVDKSQRTDNRLVVATEIKECSIAIAIDFIESVDYRRDRQGRLLDQVVRWPCLNPQLMVSEWLLHLTADMVPPRDCATFTWYQQH